jgi:hypothetical protein
MCVAKELDEVIGFLPLTRRHPNFVNQVGPGEAGDEGFRLVQGELLDDVAADPVGGRGRQGDRGRVAQQAAEIAELGIIGAKIMPPFADAVRFVDRQQPRPRRSNHVEEPPAAEPFGRNIDQPELPCCHTVKPVVLLGRGQGAVDEVRRQTQRLKLIDLILHQGDQGRDDQGQTVSGDGRQLVAEALPPSGGHYAKAVLPGQHRRNHLFLPSTEQRQTEPGEMRFQRYRGIGEHSGVLTSPAL